MKRILIVITTIMLLLIPAAGESAVVIHEPGTHHGNRHNAMRAAELLNNYVIHPGQVFSYNSALGRRTKEKGFISGYAVSGGRDLYTVGGGVCRTSTAVYQAALEAGLPVIERYPHSFRVSYAPPGMDASVWWPSADLKFRNDTDVPLVIRTEASLEKVEIVIRPLIPIYHRDDLVGSGWLEAGRTVVFLRPLAETLGAAVEWKQGRAYVNGREFPGDACRIYHGTLVVPLRELADLMDMHVGWESDRVTIDGGSPNPAPYPFTDPVG